MATIMEKPPKFYFYKARRIKWDAGRSQDEWRIIYKRQEIGNIRKRDDGKFKIVFQADATPEQLANNPNRNWQWMRLKQSFDTAEQAKEWIKENAILFHGLIATGLKKQ